MKTKDRIKEEIGLYKLFMTVALAVLSSLIGWSWNGISPLNLKLKNMIYLMLCAFFILILILFLKIDSRTKELDYD